ncbi:hypothetical protein [Rhodobacter sp. 24-YEA-8]|uniref:hypothetical protein n=1 Tax=Rhodobacter sp. 24-YEA-8 TaxID=1884310 RepID=UPI00089A449B|nr:hypothetical protein [Rhodobacter sp. 24-YEA-8]SED42863.1 hypothetical protein SAMN05519105_3978 [Rhodobacter sp. 24-YEA-8]
MKILKLSLTLAAVLVLAGCYESGSSDSNSSGGSGSTGGTGGGSVTVRPPVYTCPSNCQNVQTRTSCQAAESYYQVYVENARAGTAASTLEQLYDNHARSAGLARSMVQQIGCAP